MTTRRKLPCVTHFTCGPALGLACRVSFSFHLVLFREAFAAGSESLGSAMAQDSAIHPELAVEMIRMAGCACRCVGTGQEAVALAASGDYHLVFMDCMMPGMDGYGATRAIRAAEAERSASGERTYRIPIIAMTANAVEGDLEVCPSAGMDDSPSKPLDPDEVASMLARWLISDGVAEPGEITRRTSEETVAGPGCGGADRMS